MDEVNRRELEFDGFKANRRKAVRFSPEDLIKMDYLDPEKRFPMVMEPNAAGMDLVAWAESNHESLSASCWRRELCFFAASRLKAWFSLSSLPARSLGNYWIIVNGLPPAGRSAHVFTLQPNSRLINPFLCIMRWLTLIIGRLRSGFIAHSRRSRGEAPRSPMIGKSST